MADVHNLKTRSYNMSQIKSKNTKPELQVRKFLHHHGYRYRLHNNKLPGKPDLVLKKYKTIIQVYGCFWHGHKGCKYFKIPKTRTDWWTNKIEENIRRDHQSEQELKRMGWNLLIVWECELKKGDAEKTLNNLVNCLKTI